MSTMSGSDMTIEELASATGLTVGDVQQLESFGLVSGRVVGGISYYDDDALAIARAAAGFARFGVEARHLRLHKHAAEREAGFIEQIVLPLLKQRNPEARQRAVENVAELSRLGQSLRSVLLRNALRDQLGG
jgi:DNA-binding transcriptional MerR regulator